MIGLGVFKRPCADVHELALAYYFSGDDKYAPRRAELVRVWFF